MQAQQLWNEQGALHHRWAHARTALCHKFCPARFAWVQVSKLRAELRGADACHQQQGASVPAVQQQGQQQQQQEQERQQQQEGQPTSSGGDGVSAGAGPRRVWMWPKLLEYVTPAPGSELAALAHKVFGRVVYSNQV